MKSKSFVLFEETMLLYSDSWESWIESDFCFLSEKEIAVAAMYIKTQSISCVAEHIKRTPTTTKNTVDRVRRKLIYGYSIYKKWKETQKEDALYPLNIPIPCLKAPVRLKRCLIHLGDTLREILQDFSVEELLRMRGFGKTTIEDLRILLDQYGYASLIRQTKAQDFSELINRFEQEIKFVEEEKCIKQNWVDVGQGDKLRPLLNKVGKGPRRLFLPSTFTNRKSDIQKEERGNALLRRQYSPLSPYPTSNK